MAIEVNNTLSLKQYYTIQNYNNIRYDLRFELEYFYQFIIKERLIRTYNEPK
tara:strand:- start:423 stop:578 length:156 start_codon:yes stop_codon:yes gene_type:complete